MEFKTRSLWTDEACSRVINNHLESLSFPYPEGGGESVLVVEGMEFVELAHYMFGKSLLCNNRPAAWILASKGFGKTRPSNTVARGFLESGKFAEAVLEFLMDIEVSYVNEGVFHKD